MAARARLQKPPFHKRWRFFVLIYLTIMIEKVSAAPLMRCRIRGYNTFEKENTQWKQSVLQN